jgi:7,8-dihydro-6-hydroxymethylpterin-pyrophosphokinase
MPWHSWTPPESACLLEALMQIEAGFGRERSFRNAPRVLDLDILLYQDTVLDDPQLLLPHPRMHQRAFVMVPLAEIAPDLQVGSMAGCCHCRHTGLQWCAQAGLACRSRSSS